MPSPTYRLINEYRKQGYAVIAGLDEAGKGAWAGPVVSAAVILSEKAKLPGLNDSKLLSPTRREELYELIIGQAIAWGAGIIDAYLVDELGLAEAHRQSMRNAVREMKHEVDLLLVDGLGIRQLGIEAVCVVRGDQKVTSIAAASIIAKVTRDRLMQKYHEDYPEYGFDRHKGYGTKEHQQALLEHGISGIHRLSYAPVGHAWQGDLFQYAT